MKQETIFRYAGTREQFKPILEELENMGITVHYADALSSNDILIGMLQMRSSDNKTLEGMLKERIDYFKDKGILFEDSLARYAQKSGGTTAR